MAEEQGSVCRAVAQNIRSLRRVRGWSTREVAERCVNAGAPSLTRGTLAKLENGHRASVTVDELDALAAVFDVAAQELLGASNAAPRQEHNPSVRPVEFTAELATAVRDVVNPAPGADVVARIRTARRLMAQLVLELDEIEDRLTHDREEA